MLLCEFPKRRARENLRWGRSSIRRVTVSSGGNADGDAQELRAVELRQHVETNDGKPSRVVEFPGQEFFDLVGKFRQCGVSRTARRALQSETE